MSSNDYRFSRLNSVRPQPREWQEDEFEKGLRELEQLQQINHDLTVIEDVIKTKIRTVEETLMIQFREVVDLLALKGVAMIKHVAKDKQRERERQEREPQVREGPAQEVQQVVNIIEAPVEREREQQNAREQAQLSYFELLEAEFDRNDDQSQPQQREIRQIRVAEREGGPKGCKILQSFEKYEPELYKKLIMNGLFMSKVLNQANFLTDKGFELRFYIAATLRSRQLQPGQTILGQPQFLQIVQESMFTERNRRMFDWPFMSVLTAFLMDKNQPQQRLPHQRRQENRNENQRENQENQIDSSESSRNEPNCQIF